MTKELDKEGMYMMGPSLIRKFAEELVAPVLVDDDVLLPDGTTIAAGTNMDDLEPHVLDALEKYYIMEDKAKLYYASMGGILLSACCDMPPLFGLDIDNTGTCSRCKDHSVFVEEVTC